MVRTVHRHVIKARLSASEALYADKTGLLTSEGLSVHLHSFLRQPAHAQPIFTVWRLVAPILATTVKPGQVPHYRLDDSNSGSLLPDM